MPVPGGGREEGRAAAARQRRVAGVLVVFLLAATIAAFALTEALKLDVVPVTDPKVRRAFSPTCGCAARKATISFALRERDTIHAEVVDEADGTVRVLASGEEEPQGRVTLRWNGRDETGRVVPDGTYRIRIRLEEAGRSIVLGRGVRVDTEPPAVALVSASPRVLSAGSEEEEEVELSYRTGERARAALVVDGVVAVRQGFREAGTRTLAWDGTLDGRRAPGVYDLGVRIRDRAGNASESESVRVRVR